MKSRYRQEIGLKFSLLTGEKLADSVGNVAMHQGKGPSPSGVSARVLSGPPGLSMVWEGHGVPSSQSLQQLCNNVGRNWLAEIGLQLRRAGRKGPLGTSDEQPRFRQ
jgi:hypothetical protein